MQLLLQDYLRKQAALIDRALHAYSDASKTPSRYLKQAMDYALFSGGKRLRPILVLASSAACGGKTKEALPAAAAIEMIHTYSLVHDDLPAMDNDDVRRGKPTTHKKYGEAIAILAGDALLTKAFEILSKHNTLLKRSPAYYAKLITCIASSTGMMGMVGGQAEDILSEQVSQYTIRRVQRIHNSKTGALITASCTAGALCALAHARHIQHLVQFGKAFGLAFQIFDDILDIIGDKKKLGKRGSDRDNKRLTFSSVWGIEKSLAFAKTKIKEAIAHISIFGSTADPLRWLAQYVVERDH